MSETVKQPTCAERVEAAYQSRTDDLRRLLAAHGGQGPTDRWGDAILLYVLPEAHVCEECLSPKEQESVDAGDVTEHDDLPARCSRCDADFPDDDGDLEDLGNLHEYGLSFDYVAPGTFNDQTEGYWRYQISWGGPSEEYRFFASSHADPCYRIEFWYLDWFDGAPRSCGSEETPRTLWEWFQDAGAAQHSELMARE